MRLVLCVIAAAIIGSASVFAQAVIQKGDIPGVQLNQDQKQAVYNIRQQARSQLRQIMNDRSLTDEQKDARMLQVIDQAHKRVLELLTPQQRSKFETWWQTHVEQPVANQRTGAGPSHLIDILTGVPGVDQNTLTDSQKQRIQEIRINTFDRINKIEADPKLTESQKMQQIEQERFNGHTQVMGILTPEQRRQFESWWTGR